MNTQYTVLFLCIPASGHVNPLASVAYQLSKNKNMRVIFYGNQEHRQVIENGNVEFRNFELDIFINQMSSKSFRKNFPINEMLLNYMDMTSVFMPELLKTIETEKVDLIVYDSVTPYAKWLIYSMRRKYDKGKLEKRPPRCVMFSATFFYQQGLYPNVEETKFRLKSKYSIFYFIHMAWTYWIYIKFCFKLGIEMENPIKMLLFNKEELNIVGVVPEIQPRWNMYPKSIRFVGSCANEEIRSVKELSEPLNGFLSSFKPINPAQINNDLKLEHAELSEREKNKLIYCSFGTILNDDWDPIILIIEAIKTYDQSKHTVRLLVSTGETTYKNFQNLIEQGKYSLPPNILLMPRVPQLDVLKRASLFITHSGQGSTSESIHYGVPMLCIPVTGDQPSVAYRISDELGLGKRMDYDNLSVSEIRDNINELLTDNSYLERLALYSKISRKYNGPAEASKIVIEYLQNNQIKNKTD